MLNLVDGCLIADRGDRRGFDHRGVVRVHELRERLNTPSRAAFLATQELAVRVVQGHLAGREVPFPQSETRGFEREREFPVAFGVFEPRRPQVVDECETTLAQDAGVHVGARSQGGDQALCVRACPEAERLIQFLLQLAVDRLAHGASSGIPTL